MIGLPERLRLSREGKERSGTALNRFSARFNQASWGKGGEEGDIFINWFELRSSWRRLGRGGSDDILTSRLFASER